MAVKTKPINDRVIASLVASALAASMVSGCSNSGSAPALVHETTSIGHAAPQGSAKYLAISARTDPKQFVWRKRSGELKPQQIIPVCTVACNPSPYWRKLLLEPNLNIYQSTTSSDGSGQDDASVEYEHAHLNTAAGQFIFDAPQDGGSLAVPAILPDDVPKDQWVVLYGQQVYLSSVTDEAWGTWQDGTSVHIVADDISGDLTVTSGTSTFFIPNTQFSGYLALAPGQLEAASTWRGRGAAAVIMAGASMSAFNMWNSPFVKAISWAGPWGRVGASGIVLGAGAIGAWQAYKRVL